MIASSTFLPSAGEAFGTPLRRWQSGDFLLGESRYGAGVDMPPHRHPNPYLALVVRGRLIERDAHTSRTYGTGSLHFHPAHDPHSGRTGPGGMVALSVVPSGRIRDRLLAAAGTIRGGELASGAAALVARGYRELHTRDTASSLVLEELLLELFASLMRTRGEIIGLTAPRWLGPVRDRLHAFEEPPATLGELARLAGVHRVYLVRAFRKFTGRTPGAYLRELRLERARLALLESRQSLAQVAFGAGFSSQSHFTRAFHARHGTSPGRYRRFHS